MANNVIKRVWNQNRMVAIEDLKGMTFQAESGGHTFQISGVDDAGNTVALTGSVAGVFLRPDNTDVAITGSASGGVVSVTLPANCYDVPGRFGLTVFVTANGQKTAVYAAIGTVSRTSSGTVSPGTTSDVVDLINRINAAVATIPASWTGLMADIAPTYSDAAVYPVGAYCYYNGDLYRCTTAITTAESWTAGHWKQAVLGNDVSDLKSANDALYNTLGDWGDLSYSVVVGKLMNVNSRTEVTFATGAYFICTQPETCTKLKVTALTQGSDNAYPLFTFFNANDEIISKFGGVSVQYTDEVVSVPSGTKYFICNYSTENGAFFSISGFYVTINETEQKNKIYYDLSNNVLYVSTRYNATSDLVVLLQKKGGNNLFDFGTFYLNQNIDIYPKSNLTAKTLLYETGSDYHGPMVVRTVNNRDGDNPYSQYWTGGNHQYNNTGVGSTPTARCTNLKFFVDGAEITEGHGYCSDIRITWTNYVQSYSTTKEDGTGREVIQENHVLTFDGEKWDSYVELIALEDVIFQRYYGFQYGGIASIYPKVRYIGAVNRLEYDAQEVNSESGDKTCSMIKGYGPDHCIIMELDTNFDLGKREHYTGTQGALTLTYGKGYFYVIANETTDDANYRVNAGELIAMRGAYSFVPTFA